MIWANGPAVTRALAFHHPILSADEPTGNFDTQTCAPGHGGDAVPNHF